jgi:tetratricopeptide (TPR) repeat protein
MTSLVDRFSQRAAISRWGLLLLAFGWTFAAGGCRAIRQHAEAPPTIVARKLSRLGLEAMHQLRWDEAEEHFSAALELNETDDRAHWGLAEALWQRQQREEAIEHMEQAVRLSGGDPQLLVRMGRMYLEVGRVEDATIKSRQALRGGRELAAAWALRGDVLARLQRDEGALAAYHRALGIEADYPEVQVAIAELYHRQGRYDRLLATLDRLQDNVEASACPIRAQYLRGLAMHRLGRPREAAECFERVAQQRPGDSDVLIRLGEAYLAAGNRPAARRIADRVMRLDERDPHARALLAQLDADAGTATR